MTEKTDSEALEKKLRELEHLKIKDNVSKEERDLALSKSEALFRGLFDNMTSGSAIYEVINDGAKGADYIIKGFNNKSLELENKTLDQVIGKSLVELRPAIDDYGLIPVMKKVWETGKAAYHPVKIYIDKKFSNYYENYIFKIPSGEVVTIYNDVTEQKKAELELKESKERFELAMRFVNDGLFDWNLETNEIYYSPAWKKMLGYEDSEISNDFSEWERLTSPDDVKASLDMLNKVLEGKRNRFEKEFRMLHKDGHWVDILSRANAVFDKTGKAVRVVGTHVDITERKLAEDQIRASLEEKTVLLRELYHRTKNNMQVICSMLSLQSVTIDDPQLLKILKDTENRIHSMSLVHQKLYQGGNLSNINLKEYITDLSDLLMKSYRIQADKVSLVVFAPNDISVTIDIAIPCGLVLNELISNSLKYAFPNDMKGEIIIRLHKNDKGEIELSVCDNGVGIPQNSDFRKADTLGLKSIFSIVEHQLQGTVDFESDNGVTCRLRFKKDLYPERI